MGIFGGVTVTGFIAPSSSGDTYATIDPIYGIDGLRSVTSSVERNAITTLRRRNGMLTYQQDNNTYYKLLASPWSSTDTDWEILTFGTSGVSPYSNILVSATGADSYSGTSIPVITGYSESYVYITTFDSSNTTTASTINIEGLGNLDLVKVGEEGLIPLDPYDILSGVTYYTIYNGTNMQVLSSQPVDNPSTYTTFLGPIPINIGGVTISTQFSAATMQQVFDTLFYPLQGSVFSNFYISQLGAINPSILEVGHSISGGSYNFIWATSYPANVKPNSIIIKNNVNAVISTPTSGITNDFNELITLPLIINSAPTTYVWKINGTKINNSAMPVRTYTATWRYRRYWGNSVDAIPTSGMVTTLAYQDINGHSIYYTPTSAASAFPFSGAPGTYKYMCYPTSTPNVTSIKDNLTLLNMAMADPTDGTDGQTPNLAWYYYTVPIINQYGITNNYKCFRSKYQLGGAINIRFN